MLFKSKSKYDFLIVGLGNPGDKYSETRHNVGFCCIDILADELKVNNWKNKFQSTFCDTEIGDKKVMLVKPQTFMNNSGAAVSEIVKFYKISPEKIIVISDDVSLDAGRLRIRKNGSHGGHNGLKDIIELLGTDNFPRVKIGIGKKPDGWDLADWVLGKYSEEDLKALDAMYENSVEAAKLIMAGKTDDAMNKFN
jgi:PTH1 family peptidyl-tRNA hydrolase